MRIDDMLRELESVAERKKIKVSYEAMGGELGSGGLCKVRGEHRIIVDKRVTAGEKVALLAAALGRFDLEDVFISEETRGLIERTRSNAAAAAADPGVTDPA